MIFVGMSVSRLAFAECKLKISFNICFQSTCEKEEKFLLPVAYLSYFEYAWVVSIFYNGLNNWIVDVVWNRVAVSIFCNFLFGTILSDKNGLMVFQKVLLSVYFFHQHYYNITFPIFWQETHSSYVVLNTLFYCNQFYFPKICFWVDFFSLFLWKKFYS